MGNKQIKKLINKLLLLLFRILIFSDYEKLLTLEKLIINQENIEYNVIDSDYKRGGYNLIIVYNNKEYIVPVYNDEYYNLDYENPKLYYYIESDNVYSELQVEVIYQGFYFYSFIVVLIVLPYKITALLLMKIKPINNYIKETEPKLYGLYLDTINKKKSLK